MVLQGYFDVHPKAKMLTFRLIICTCVDAGILCSTLRIQNAHRCCNTCLADTDVPVGHFTHIFIDEAAQANEPETLIPISLAGSESEYDREVYELY